ncbi:TRAP transporter large permease [Thalassobacillus devorans]|uniref:TRAP transporter large permease n=1 Tax=Thalassobacillus devorans TaxID=279813 RepID=UPI000A1CF18B|nr:TRAP transporter large permease [Thalassobacillus devorans]
MSVALLVSGFLLMLILGFPIIFSIGIACLFYLLINDVSLAVVSQVMVNYLTDFVLLAVPLFIFAAQLMNASGMTGRLLKFARNLIGHIRGGLAHVNVLTSMIFAGVSGSAVADTSSVGTVMIKAMKDEGYETDYAAAVSASSSVVGPIIPPSIPMVVAGAMAGLSVTQLFIGGIVPGILLGLAMMVVVAIIAKKRDHPKFERASYKTIMQSFTNSILDLVLPAIVIGGIVFGLFTPTEGAAVAVLAAMVLGVIHKDLTLRKVRECAYQSIIVSAEVLLIAAVAILFGWILMYEQIPQNLIQYVTDMEMSKYLFLIIINLILLALGAFIAGMATLLIAVPILVPIAPFLNMDPYQMVVMIVLATMLGTITPPIGPALFIISSVSKRSVGAIAIQTIPFLVACVVVLLLVAFIPAVSLFLPDLIYGK